MKSSKDKDKVEQLKFGRPTEKPSNANINYYRSISNMTLVFDIILSVLSTINVAIHGVGFYLFISLYRNGQQSVQQLFLINLSLIECMFNLIDLPACITDYLSRSNGDAIFGEVSDNLYD